MLPQIRRRKPQVWYDTPQVWYDTLTVGVTPPVTKGDIPLEEGDNSISTTYRSPCRFCHNSDRTLLAIGVEFSP